MKKDHCERCDKPLSHTRVVVKAELRTVEGVFPLNAKEQCLDCFTRFGASVEGTVS